MVACVSSPFKGAKLEILFLIAAKRFYYVEQLRMEASARTMGGRRKKLSV